MPSKHGMATRQKASPAWPNEKFNGFVGNIQTNSKEQNSTDMVRCATSSHSEAGGIRHTVCKDLQVKQDEPWWQMFIMFRFEGMNTVILHTRCTYKKDWWQWHIMNFDWLYDIHLSCTHEQHDTSSNLPDHRLRLKTSFTCQVMPSAKCSNRWDFLRSVSHPPKFQDIWTTEINFWITTSTKKHREILKPAGLFFCSNDAKVDDEKVEILKRMPQWVELSLDLDGFGEGWTKGFGDGLAILIDYLFDIFCRYCN